MKAKPDLTRSPEETPMNTILRDTPAEPLERQQRAVLLHRQGRTAEALVEYEAAVEGWARAGAMLRAMALCKVILQLDPRHLRAPTLLADLHAQRSTAQQAPASETPAQPVAPLPFFSSLSRELFLEVFASLDRREYAQGEVIVNEGAPGRSMFIVVEGEARVMRQGSTGQPTPLATLRAGEFFGEMALVSGGPRLSRVVAETEMVLLELTRERMELLSAHHPELAEVVHRLYRQRLLANALRSNPLFANWPEELCHTVSEAFTPISCEAGEEILTQGRPSHALYLLLRGRCAAFHRHADGHETAYPAMAEGDVFGEISLLRGKPASASVRALSPCVLLKLEREVLEQHLPRHPMLHKELQRLGAERMLRTTMLLCGRPIYPPGLRA
jgi:cAMP-dependent protein kinase regulator